MELPLQLAFFIDDLIVGGTQRWLTKLIPGLVSRGYEIRVYGLRRFHHPSITRKLESYAQVEIIGEGRLWRGEGLRHLYRALKDVPIDIIQTLLPTSDMIGRTMGHLAGVPVIASSVRGRNLDKPAWQRWLDRRTARWARTVIFNSQGSIPGAMRREGVRPDQVVYIPNGVEIEEPRQSRAAVRAELQTASDVPVVGTLGRLHVSKGQDNLLGAFQRFRRRYPTAVLWLLGEGDGRAALEREIRHLDIEESVRLPGVREDVREVLEAMDIFVLPSRWEGMPNALLEAMAAAKPVVASNVDGIRELIRDRETGRLIRPGDIDSLTTALVEMWADHNRAAAIGRAAQTFMRERYSLQSMVDAYDRLYRDLWSLSFPRV